MATNFPASLDTLTNPTSSDSLSSPSHSAQHANVNDAVEALQAKVGADSSAVTSSLDYKVAQLEALGTSVAFTPSWNNSTPGNATETWHYVQVNDFVIVQGRTILGSTSSVSSNATMDPPVGSTFRFFNGTSGTVEYVIGGNVYIGHWLNQTLGRQRLIVSTIGTSYVERTGITATVPATWAAGDEIRGSFIYQIIT